MHIADAVCKSRALYRLHIVRNYIEATGTNALATSVTVTEASVANLNLCGNRIGVDGLRSLIETNTLAMLTVTPWADDSKEQSTIPCAQ